MFAAIEAQKVRLGIENYALSQATLDQVFIRLASEQEKEEGTGASRDPSLRGEIEASAWLGFYKELQDHIGPDATEAFLCHLLEAPVGQG